MTDGCPRTAGVDRCPADGRTGVRGSERVGDWCGVPFEDLIPYPLLLKKKGDDESTALPASKQQNARRGPPSPSGEGPRVRSSKGVPPQPPNRPDR